MPVGGVYGGNGKIGKRCPPCQWSSYTTSNVHRTRTKYAEGIDIEALLLIFHPLRDKHWKSNAYMHSYLIKKKKSTGYYEERGRHVRFYCQVKIVIPDQLIYQLFYCACTDFENWL